MSVYLYSLYALLNFSLLVWAVRLWRPARPAGTGFLALVLFGLFYDNALVAAGRFVPAGDLLLVFSYPRFALHQLVLPWIIVSAFELARQAGLTWTHGARAARLAWAGAAVVMVIGVATRLVPLRLEPEVVDGLTRYVARGVSGPPLVSVLSIGFVGFVGLSLWRAGRGPWIALIVLGVFIGEGLPIPAVRLVLGAGLEIGLMAALLALTARLGRRGAPLANP
ncbi:MAG: hypothetical protein KA764_22080 [Anaerolineales bacterium]|nr:hypothetical protein [Anaerolineales bacterium]